MTDTDTLTTLAAQRTRLLEQQEQIDQELEANKAMILDATDGADRYAAGPVDVVITCAARINSAQLMKAYPPDACPEIYTQTVDVKAARHFIAEVDLEPYMTYSAPSVRIA